ncbi:MAG: M23 family metallopeptidase [Bacteroidales bacterium]|nr:M23 family metallopeptidase [Bacteroidales bacterium]MDE6236293.1 M23 family metallopeptidase [Muribaculaceae bacterium]
MALNKRKIRIKIESVSSLSTIADRTSPIWKVALFSILFIIASLFGGALIVFFTPLHTLLPGYLKEDQRAATEDNILRLDSLREVYETNQRFIDNYLRVTDISRVASDSVPPVAPDSIHHIKDTLMLPTERERKFVARMEEQERFNISVLAPLAAEGMFFSNPADAGIFLSSSKDSYIGIVVIPSDSQVLSIADGTVIAVYFSRREKGYVAIIQHSRGFVSRYAGMGVPLVSMGENVDAGQIIAAAPSPDKFGKRLLDIRMWHNTLPVIPYNFIHESEITHEEELFGQENSFDAPRGK